MNKRIILYPNFGENQYTENLYKAINSVEGTDLTIVDKITPSLIKLGVNAFDVAVVNWLENGIVTKGKKVSCLSVFKLLTKFFVLKVISKKIIYVRHNIYPHALTGFDATVAKYITNALARFSDQCVVHSGHLVMGNVHYIPHPLYQLDTQLISAAPDNFYIIFGRIVKYKAIDKLLDSWSNQKLVIAGKVDSTDYLIQLKNQLIRNALLKKVTLDARFLDDSEAARMVSSSSGLIITHSDQDMIVSGSFFFASSLGVPVFAVRTPFFDWLIKTFNYPGLFVYDDIETLVQGVSAFNPKNVSREEILESAQNLFGDEVVKQYWKKLLINIE